MDKSEAALSLSRTGSGARARARVVLTDHPWIDLQIERGIIEAAGFELVAGPVAAPDAAFVEAMVAQADPLAILTCWAPVSAAAIASPRALAIVARLGVGLDNIDVAAADARGAWVTNVPDYCVAEVSDHALGLALSLERGITQLDRRVRARGWHVPSFVPRRIGTLVVGIIGYGRIGRVTAAKFQALGCRVIAFDPHAKPAGDAVALVPLAELQDRADVIILHAPLTAQSQHLVDAGFIAACHSRPVIVNVSRGGLIDNQALESGLQSGVLRGAALDVIDGEPDPPASLMHRDDVIVTPHVAYLSDASLEDLRRSACEEVVRVLNGHPPRHPRNSPAQVAAATVALPGGVSSDIRLTQGPDGEIVIKTALGRLKVQAEWVSSPERSQTEVDAILATADLIGARFVPEILWSRPEQHSFAMRRVDPRLRNWKQDLLAGHVDPATSQQAGVLLGRLHRGSMSQPGLAARFADTTYFRQLRAIPFFENVASRIPELATAIHSVLRAMEDRATCLVHGDYSPKNILADGAQLVILDFEVAHWGDPRFDVAFCLSHLLLKASRSGADRGAFEVAMSRFLLGYAAEAGPAPDDAELVRLTGCLVLSRLAGDSPVDYIGDLDIAALRAIAHDMIMAPAPSIQPHFTADKERAR